MTKTIHNKLVRDNIPKIIQSDSATPVTRVLAEDEYKKELLKKLIEEASELLDSDGSLDERADIEEVLKALDEVLGYSDAVIEQARYDKAQKRGAFKGRIFLESVKENTE